MAKNRANHDALFTQAQVALAVHQFNKCQTHLEVLDFPEWDELTKIRYLRALIYKAKLVESYEERLAHLLFEKRDKTALPLSEPTLDDHSQALLDILKA